MLSRIRSLELTVHNSRIGEPFQYRSFLLLTAEAPTRKICRPLATALVLVLIQNPLG